MNRIELNRRDFIRSSAVLAGTAFWSPWALSTARAQPAAAAATGVRRTATDQVTLGNTGIKLSRLGIGTGVNGGHDQAVSGKEAFIKVVRHAYDSGITYIDAAQRYETFPWMGEAISGIPREKLFIQSKIPGPPPDDILATIDSHRKNFDTDYIDSILVHCMTREGWTDQWKRAMDGFAEAKDRKWIRCKGVSCHRLGALREATASDFNEVHLVRVNPQGWHMDDVTRAPEDGNADISNVMAEIKSMHARGRGVIGMKIFGDGDFTTSEARERSMRFAMSVREINAIVIGFKRTSEIDDTVAMMNRVLAEV